MTASSPCWYICDMSLQLGRFIGHLAMKFSFHFFDDLTSYKKYIKTASPLSLQMSQYHSRDFSGANSRSLRVGYYRDWQWEQ